MIKNITNILHDYIDAFDARVQLAKLALSSRARIRLYRKISSLARTGMPLPRALDAIHQVETQGGKKPNVSLAVAVESWRHRIYDGYSFGRALDGWVPAREWMIIEAGAGDLGHALDDAAKLVESSRKMLGAVGTAVGYPLFLAALLCVLLWIFSVDAIPAFAEIKPMEQWTGMASGMAALSNLVRGGMIPFLVASLFFWGVALWSLPVWTGDWRARIDDFPPWSFYRLVMGTSFLTSLVAFLRAGMPVPEALRRLRSSANPWLAERIDATLYFVNSGHDLGEALHFANYSFPAREIIADLRVYATLGNLDEAMDRITAEWVTHSLDSLRAAGDSMKVLGMVVVAMTIAWVQLGIIAVQQQLTSGL